MDAISEPEISREDYETEYIPILRSGGWADIGIRPSMEDAFVCCDNFMQDYGLKNFGEGPGAFYGVLFLGIIYCIQIQIRKLWYAKI